MDVGKIIDGLKLLKTHNPKMFHIFYGGEPFLRELPDLISIVKFCHENDIEYTFISNCTEKAEERVFKLIENIGSLKGFTASIDLLDRINPSDVDISLKSRKGLSVLEKLKEGGKVQDIVAEITVTNRNVLYLYEIVNYLSLRGITSDITFVDISKTPYYDFSNVKNEMDLVNRTSELAEQFQKLYDDHTLLIHMKENLLVDIWHMLPSNMNCKIDKNLHNITIDADGSIRLCLRIRGVYTPSLNNIKNLFSNKGEITQTLKNSISKDKSDFCKLCNHTCHLMSLIIDKDNKSLGSLIHSDRRL
jgi:MoaA/NifB/PqqE/SkfB family radical SAM enzyme